MLDISSKSLGGDHPATQPEPCDERQIAPVASTGLELQAESCHSFPPQQPERCAAIRQSIAGEIEYAGVQWPLRWRAHQVTQSTANDLRDHGIGMMPLQRRTPLGHGARIQLVVRSHDPHELGIRLCHAEVERLGRAGDPIMELFDANALRMLIDQLLQMRATSASGRL